MRNRSLFLLLFFLVSCFSSQDISNSNLSSFYRSSDRLFHPSMEVYLYQPDSARLYVRFNTKELLFVNAGNDRFMGTLKIVCRLLESYEAPTAYDTIEKVFTLPQLPEGNSTKVFTLDIAVPKKQTYLLEVTLADVRKNTTDVFFVGLDAASPQSRNAYLVTRPGSTVPIFQNYLQATDTVVVTFRDTTVPRFIVKYYRREFPLASPPYSFDYTSPFNYRYDSMFTVQAGVPLAFPREGFYHFLIDTGSVGLTLFRFSRGFPDVTQTATMIESVRYLTSKREFEEIKLAADPKAAIDKFWMNAGSNQDRTRLLIKKYYGRIQEANRLFTSYTEGWRTDRGMLYTVMGSPHVVYRSSVSESWVYGQAGSPISISFSFTKVLNPFTDNDFILSRAPVYEAHWHQAVDVWRQGRVYNDSN